MDPRSARDRWGAPRGRAIHAACLVAAMSLCSRAEANATAEQTRPPRSVVGLDLVRLGFPSGIGVGVRGFVVPQLALEAGATTFVLATTLELSISTLPLRGGPDRKVQPLLRVGYRRMFVHEASDRVVRGALPPNARGLSEEIVLEGARLHSIFVALGFAYRFERPVALEASLGYLAQVGSATANGGREALELSAARFAVADVRVTFLLPRGRRP